jgi:beta-lactamase superfamily II metal-dependent hydrolase
MKLKVIPAGDGDCFICEFNNEGNPYRILVDGGVKSTFDEQLRPLFDDPAFEIDLVIVTHVDDDHIAGIIALLEDPIASKRIKSIWFNGYKHCPASSSAQTYGIEQADTLSGLIEGLRIPWNEHFGFGAVALNADGSSRSIPLGADTIITIVSPGMPELLRLKGRWEKEWKRIALRNALKAARAAAKAAAKAARSIRQTFAPLDIEELADPTSYTRDSSVTNASSIAFVLDADGASIFFSADALPEVVCSAWAKGGNAPREVGIFKVSHHGSLKNTNAQLLNIFRSAQYVISTSGDSHNHPDRESVARIIKHSMTPPKIYFNYNNKYTSIWADPEVSNRQHTAEHGNGHAFLEINL